MRTLAACAHQAGYQARCVVNRWWQPRIAAVMDVGLDLPESPPNGADLGLLRERPRQHGAGSGEVRWVIARSAGAWLRRREPSPRPAAAVPPVRPERREVSEPRVPGSELTRRGRRPSGAGTGRECRPSPVRQRRAWQDPQDPGRVAPLHTSGAVKPCQAAWPGSRLATCEPGHQGAPAKAHSGRGPSRWASSWHTWRTGTPARPAAARI